MRHMRRILIMAGLLVMFAVAGCGAELLDNTDTSAVSSTLTQSDESQTAAVVLNSEALHKTEAEDGDDVYYIESTNEFVVVSADGYIRTYFKPDSGIRYYNRQ